MPPRDPAGRANWSARAGAACPAWAPTPWLHPPSPPRSGQPPAAPSAAVRAGRREGSLGGPRPTSRSGAAADPGDTGGGGHRPAAVSQAVPVAAPPNMLPADVVDFTGRDAEVGLLCRALAPGQRTATPVAA